MAEKLVNTVYSYLFGPPVARSGRGQALDTSEVQLQTFGRASLELLDLPRSPLSGSSGHVLVTHRASTGGGEGAGPAPPSPPRSTLLDANQQRRSSHGATEPSEPAGPPASPEEQSLASFVLDFLRCSVPDQGAMQVIHAKATPLDQLMHVCRDGTLPW